MAIEDSQVPVFADFDTARALVQAELFGMAQELSGLGRRAEEEAKNA